MIRKILLFLLITFVITDQYGQDDPRWVSNNTFVIGLGIPIIKVRDKGNSPLLYSGIGTTIYLGWENYNFNRWISNKLIFHTGTSNPSYKPKAKNVNNSVDITMLEYRYTYAKRIGNSSDIFDWTKYAGVTISSKADIRNYNLLANNLLSFYSGLSVMPAFKIAKYDQNRKIHLKGEIEMNLFSIAMRPNYLGTIEFPGFKPKKFEQFKRFKFNTLFTDFMINTDINVNKQHNQFASTLGYNWQYHHNTQSTALDMIYGGFYYKANFNR